LNHAPEQVNHGVPQLIPTALNPELNAAALNRGGIKSGIKSGRHLIQPVHRAAPEIKSENYSGQN
jgi:hypothetical protein